MTTLKVLFAPAEFAVLEPKDLSGATCVVFDVLRATSTMITALQHGALGVVPVATIEEAIRYHKLNPSVLLAGERHGLKIGATQTGGVDFDFGNSPREFVADRVAGKIIVSTTTNGTRALRACAGASGVFAASFANLRATAVRLRELRPNHLLLVCSGTGNEASYEDALCAGALVDQLWDDEFHAQRTDSSAIARTLYRSHRDNLNEAIQHAANGRRLLAMPSLRDDVQLCFEPNTVDFAAFLDAQGVVRKHQPFA